MNQTYELVVGLEVHAELSTDSKIYCGCKNEFGRQVNSNCCPICMGFPGTLPTLNKKAVEYAVKMGHALHCRIHNVSKQDRKNYFYPDLPKAYQISQYDVPLCENGYLNLLFEDGSTKRIGITRIHIEEDAGKLIHDESFQGTLVDFNRCGVPLIEIVSEPDIRSVKEARLYLETIRSYLLYLHISDAKMQEGSLRCDVNVSVRKAGETELGQRCEMKNVNTFSGAVKAIAYEYQRQVEELEKGNTIEQETRRWDEASGKTVSMRSKENAQDYRYFPEPDLGTIVLTRQEVEKLKEELPEMPNDKAARWMREYQIPYEEVIAMIEHMEYAHLFEETVKINGVQPKVLANWILGEVAKTCNETGQSIGKTKLTPERFGALLLQVQNQTISNAAGKKIFEKLLTEDKDVDTLIEEAGLKQISDEQELTQIVEQVLQENEQSVLDYKSGKTNAFGYLMGQCMKQTQGKGNPRFMKEELKRRLEK